MFMKENQNQNQNNKYQNNKYQNRNQNQKPVPEKVFSTAVSNRKSSTKTTLIFAIGFIVGVLVTSSWSSSSVSKAPVTTSTADITGVVATSTTATITTTTATARTKGIATGAVTNGSASGAVSVSNQQAGSSVLVDSVTVPPPGVWVTVQETHGDSLGNVLGATRVHGPLSNVVVSLLRNTEPNRTYAVVLYRSDGDKGLFNLKTDSVYVDFDSGKRVVVPFRTTGVSTVATPTNR